ncbi:MAG: peptide chain release factor 1 [Deltaproteobacteria bacterium]|jgi:peptide chain release factor 1|nr:peptide chain release factor 1 [Deltaproteobacteria bacterium]
MLLEKLEGIESRYQELTQLLSQAEVIADRENFTKLNKEHAELAPIVFVFEEYKKVCKELRDSKTLLDETKDNELKELALLDIENLKEKEVQLKDKLLGLIAPKDPNDDKNIILEIRAGTGGDESSIFSGDLFSMYSKYADLQHWIVEILSASEGTMGGYKEIIARIEGRGAFSRLKYERGVHRVQRVPLTETQGRIHTSTCTVAVLPEAEEVEIKIDDKDLRIDVYRSSGAGGQSVNTTDSAVRVTHIPSGLVITCQDERSQWKNKAKALMVLRSRLLALQESTASAERADDRRSQIGTGDRSERIRTYNFPQGRVSDHRIGLTLYQIETIMAGNLDSVINPLMAHYRAEALKKG